MLRCSMKDRPLPKVLYAAHVSAISMLATGWRAQFTETKQSAPQKFLLLTLSTKGRPLIEAKIGCFVERGGYKLKKKNYPFIEESI